MIADRALVPGRGRGHVGGRPREQPRRRRHDRGDHHHPGGRRRGRPGRHRGGARGDLRRDRRRHRTRHHHPRLPGRGARRRRSRLAFGIRVRSLDGSRLDGFTLDGLTIRGYTRSGSQLSGVDNFRLTGTRYVDNPLYGLFPVRCSHGRVDHNQVSGSFDSGVYVGQCSDVRVDHNVAHDNTIGLEVELSTRVVVEDNVSTDNAVGALVQISPRRAVKVTDDVLVRRNVLSGNNQPNTITEGVCWAACPAGSGLSTSPATTCGSSTTWSPAIAAAASVW